MKLCSVDGCKVKHRAKGYCPRHYRQARAGKEITLEYINQTGRVCSLDGRNRKHRAKGLCKLHYDNARYTIRPTKPIRLCTIAGCTKKHQAKGLCLNHYNQERYRRKKV
ncbi:hypothetical protein P4493_05310 [Bacillus thuringiensis]|uniref:Cysteine-rich protein n=3 Tax=Bacillus thuringiensis TaxID=1428 RepID=A0A0B5NL04_BACTU|nr:MULTISPECIES: hypothetical protein [Bacillus]EAO56188.1 Cysteine-rich protein [Bacillus thuringiensis serovar israelensis ATCC 35646]MEC2536172.1 hypothetical protein [Bacillus cereus]MED1153586.1 hypothetical protein [Bacillus paranthracis]OUB09128.1 hypothetical protein BK708_31800 [Bacillus thuringiensis serovar yunnanensis]AFQ29913.1 hypothetical protein BTF1_29062 [Bacillus thuringiensis HD-789]